MQNFIYHMPVKVYFEEGGVKKYLSKEMEKVGVVLLSSCQGVHAMDSGDGRCRACTCRCTSTEANIWRTAERELMRSISESRMFGAWTNQTTNTSGDDALRGHTRSHPEHDG